MQVAIANLEVADEGTRRLRFGLKMDEVSSSFLRTMASWFGYAAEKIAGRLQKKGGTEAAPPGAFFVKGTEGPLAEGGLERAAAWARQTSAAR